MPKGVLPFDGFWGLKQIVGQAQVHLGVAALDATKGRPDEQANMGVDDAQPDAGGGTRKNPSAPRPGTIRLSGIRKQPNPFGPIASDLDLWKDNPVEADMSTMRTSCPPLALRPELSMTAWAGAWASGGILAQRTSGIGGFPTMQLT
jgi:hypothetical protein